MGEPIVGSFLIDVKCTFGIKAVFRDTLDLIQLQQFPICSPTVHAGGMEVKAFF